MITFNPHSARPDSVGIKKLITDIIQIRQFNSTCHTAPRHSRHWTNQAGNGQNRRSSHVTKSLINNSNWTVLDVKSYISTGVHTDGCSQMLSKSETKHDCYNTAEQDKKELQWVSTFQEKIETLHYYKTGFSDASV